MVSFVDDDGDDDTIVNVTPNPGTPLQACAEELIRNTPKKVRVFFDTLLFLNRTW